MKAVVLLFFIAIISTISAQQPTAGDLIWSADPSPPPLAFSFFNIPPPVGAEKTKDTCTDAEKTAKTQFCNFLAADEPDACKINKAILCDAVPTEKVCDATKFEVCKLNAGLATCVAEPTCNKKVTPANCPDAANVGKVVCDDSGSDPCLKKNLVVCKAPALEDPVSCAGMDPSKPYCVVPAAGGDATCEAAGPTHTACTVASKFNCKQEGILPDALDCTTYYKCIADTANPGTFKVSNERKCRPGYAFDPALPADTPCRFTNNDARFCVKSNCGKTFGLQILSYLYLKADQGQVGVLCLGSEKNIPYVFRCGPGTTLVRSPTNPLDADCVLTCRSEYQKAPDNKSKKSYYVCYRSNGVLVPFKETCNEGETFDAQNLKCV